MPYAVEVKDVSMHFNMNKDKIDNLKEYCIKLFKKQLFYEDFTALQDISFQIKAGDVFGIIGLNGSGKSTLLKIISGILKPTTGSVKVTGTIAPLIELGAGFDADLTARENVFLNGSVLGFSREFMRAKFDEIIEFSELKDYIDNPVRTYSSGMYMRLAFAVAINVDADILLVDEILSVGDQHFQEKCINKMKSLKEEGKTMVFVTHSLGSAKELCDRAVWLNQGVIKMDGDTNTVIEKYIEETK